MSKRKKGTLLLRWDVLAKREAVMRIEGPCRTRLLEQGVVDAPRRGCVTFEMPLLRAYLSEGL